MVKGLKEFRKVQVDDREPLFIDALLLCEELMPDRGRLLVGDYVCGDVVVERKTVDDFCGSICDGRLKKQVVGMKEKFGRVFVVVVGRVGDRTSAIHINSVLGFMVSLVVDESVGIIFVESEEECVFVMKRIFERCCDET